MDFLDKLLGRRRKPSSREIAKERLQLVLVHDRLKVPPGLLQTLKDELIAVISKYIEIDQDGVEINLTHDKRYSRLVADIPVVKVRGRSSN